MENSKNPLAGSEASENIINNVNQKIRENFPIFQGEPKLSDFFALEENVKENLPPQINSANFNSNPNDIISQNGTSKQNEILSSPSEKLEFETPQTPTQKPTVTKHYTPTFLNENTPKGEDFYFKNPIELLQKTSTKNSDILPLLPTFPWEKIKMKTENFSPQKKEPEWQTLITDKPQNIINFNLKNQHLGDEIQKLIHNELQCALKPNFLEDKTTNFQPKPSKSNDVKNIVNNNQTYKTYNNYYNSNADFSGLLNSWDNISSQAE